MARRGIAVAFGICGVGALVASLLLWVSLQVSSDPVPGIRVGGAPLSDGFDVREEVGRRADAWLDAPVVLRAADLEAETTRRQLGARIDVDAAVASAERVGRSGDPLADLTDWWSARRGRIDMPLPVAVDRHALSAHTELLRPFVDREPAPALLDVAAHVAHQRDDAMRLDVASSIDSLARALVAGDEVLEVQVTREVGPGPRLPDGLELSTVLAGYGTEYRSWGRYRGRAHNVELAAQKLHGALIPAGGVLSFNQRIGARTGREGFRIAPVISGGEIVDGMGGGVCQVASTLHAAAFMAGMDIVEHQPHSRPSAYIPMGLDATVVWPTVDLHIRNPFPFPVAVNASATEGELHVELLGAERPRVVELERRVLGRARFGERTVEDPALPRGTRVVSQEGLLGARVERVRIVREEGRSVTTEVDVIRYPPTDRVVRVGTGPVPTANPPAGRIGAVALR